MGAITSLALESFLQRLGERSSCTGAFYLLGGSALCVLGNPRTTAAVGYIFEAEAGSLEQFQATVAELAAEMRLDVEAVPLDEFIPLPSQARERRRLVGRYGGLDVYLFDLYSIALSKIARGFEADLDDVMFLLRDRHIEFGELEAHFNAILPDAPKADVLPSEFRGYFEEVRCRLRTEAS
jgi:hypothetical protein